ncbi:MAG: hypothetical protein IPH31_04685 [Lewinellaceae bacterium]|nr:hypothetical protein [Lewinellaceae bacterium]
MEITQQDILLRQIRFWITLFVVLLILSGLTAFPIQTELNWLAQYYHLFPDSLRFWLETTTAAINDTYAKYPQLAYGYDWLAFAHIVIGIAFVGPWRDPVRNIWVIEWGMIACVLVPFLAFICGPIREIPVFWRIIDASFGVFGILPLWWVRRKIKVLEGMQSKSHF